jgi:hypothetical protein
MQIRVAWAVGVFVILAGCETVGPSDAVRDEPAAIEIAKKVCSWEKVGDGQNWHAKLSQGIWHVWFNVDYRHDEDEAINSLEIRASDGFTKGCPVVT